MIYPMGILEPDRLPLRLFPAMTARLRLALSVAGVAGVAGGPASLAAWQEIYEVRAASLRWVKGFSAVMENRGLVGNRAFTINQQFFF